MMRVSGAMNTRKRTIQIMKIILLMVVLNSVLVHADEPVNVYINNIPVVFDVPPIVENGRALVPMRAIFEKLNADIEWNEATNTVTATTEYLLRLELQIGKPTATKYYLSPADDYDYQANTGGFTKDQLQEIKLDVPAKVINGRTMVPLRFIAESMNYNVKWDGESNRVDIITKNVDIETSLKTNDFDLSILKETSAIDFMQWRITDFEEWVGTDYKKYPGELSEYAITYPNRFFPYGIVLKPYFGYGDLMDSIFPEEDTVTSVLVLEGGYVVDGFKVGGKLADLNARLGNIIDINSLKDGVFEDEAGTPLPITDADLLINPNMGSEIIIPYQGYSVHITLDKTKTYVIQAIITSSVH